MSVGGPGGRGAERFVAAVIVIAGLSMLVTGVWSWAAPRSFARWVDFPYHEHFLHDLGAFQIGIGVALLGALAWRDARTVALAAFLVANTVHAVNHANDLDLGGHASDAYAIGALSLLAGAALLIRVRQVRPVRRPAPDEQHSTTER
jgi:hypothetical protein